VLWLPEPVAEPETLSESLLFLFRWPSDEFPLLDDGGHFLQDVQRHLRVDVRIWVHWICGPTRQKSLLNPFSPASGAANELNPIQHHRRGMSFFLKAYFSFVRSEMLVRKKSGSLAHC
jgi:hypothetical protein